jgi:hypothetical protein
MYYAAAAPGTRSQNPDLGLRLRTAHEHGGLTDVIAWITDKRRTTPQGSTGERRAQERLSIDVREQLLAALLGLAPIR